jgi:hypothetical protein
MGVSRKPKAQQLRPDAQSQSGPTVKKPKHSGPKDHNQYNPDPLAHFLAIPWAAKLLTDPAAFDIVVSDRRILPSGDKQFVRSVMNSETTVRACITFLLKLPPQKEEGQRGVCPAPPFDGMGGHAADTDGKPISKSKKLLQGGGPENGEDPEKPFLLSNVLVDLGEGLCGYRGMLHGGALMVLLDEAMCAAADNQSRECVPSFDPLPPGHQGANLACDGRVRLHGKHDDQLLEACHVAGGCASQVESCQEGRAQTLGQGNH